jgi:hypothetical protein
MNDTEMTTIKTHIRAMLQKLAAQRQASQNEGRKESMNIRSPKANWEQNFSWIVDDFQAPPLPIVGQHVFIVAQFFDRFQSLSARLRDIFDLNPVRVENGIWIAEKVEITAHDSEQGLLSRFRNDG